MLHGTLSILLAVCLGVLCPLNCQGAFHAAEGAPVAACCPACAHHAPAGELPGDQPAPGQSSDAPAGNCICSGAVSGERVDVPDWPVAATAVPVDLTVLLNEGSAGVTSPRGEDDRRHGAVPLYCLLGVFLR